jgi:hypothetical protein
MRRAQALQQPTLSPSLSSSRFFTTSNQVHAFVRGKFVLCVEARTLGGPGHHALMM